MSLAFTATRRASPVAAAAAFASVSPLTNRTITTAHTTPRPNLRDAVLPLADDPANDVVFDSVYGLRTIVLNRPAKLNALSGSMIRKIVPRLAEWEKSELASVVVIKGALGKAAAFCAGGDVVALAEQNAKDPVQGPQRSAEYFANEYRLNHLIATYKKPYIALINGVTMGGGVGLSIHAPLRIATEKTVFAMPETTIGFFPDVGASFFLPRLNGAIGRYLALTSDRLAGASALYAGIATHYMHSDTIPMLEQRLAELRFHDYDPLADRLRLVADTIEEFTASLPSHQDFPLQGSLRRAIDRCFSHATIPEIMAELHRVVREGEVPTAELPKELKYTRAVRTWALAQIATLEKRSPTALHATARLLFENRTASLTTCFKREHALASRFMRHPDFATGVVTQLMHRKLRNATSPENEPEKLSWSPPSLAACPPPHVITQPLFSPAKEKLLLFTRADYYMSPHEHIALPTERWLRKRLLAMAEDDEKRKALRQVADVVDFVVEERGYRQGIREVVREMAKRCLRFLPEGGVEWTGGDVDIVLDDEPIPDENTGNEEQTSSQEPIQ